MRWWCTGSTWTPRASSSSAAARRRSGALSIAFAERRVDKAYVAVVAGATSDDAGEIDQPLAADWPNRPRQMVCRLRGKPSLTRWRVLARDAATTRLALQPLTGRSHQLRVHLASIGHPVIGDRLYGGGDGPRLLLHASAIALPHPASGAMLAFASTPPF